MRGTLLVERENTDGDRGTVATFDPEGDRDAVEKAVERAEQELDLGGVYAVRVLLERVDRDPQLRTVFYCDVRGTRKRVRVA